MVEELLKMARRADAESNRRFDDFDIYGAHEAEAFAAECWHFIYDLTPDRDFWN
jgi:hypothetical protein